MNDDVLDDEDISAAHGYPNLYKPLLSCLSDEQARICDNIYNWEKGSEIAYRNAKFGGFLYVRDLISFYADNWLTDWVCIYV